ncbi:AP-4 complex subunit mu [Forsythia ovata]|uniref:AP-4 complex subunit mu n=1 Tax=Forsythia ovata TaxID=205694 RepID=A0ABD1RKT9_9LAMI
MISQFFVLSQRGDNIVFRDCRGDVQKNSAEIFFRKVKFWKEDDKEEAPPVFNVDGVNYFHVKVVGLLFVATTRNNLSPSLVLELLQRIARVIKDYLGVLSEESLRKNFVLVYELLDEVMDFGYVQTTSTEVLKSYIFNEPIVVDTDRSTPLGPAALFMQGAKRMPGMAVTKSVVAHEPGGRKREEIFVDIIEKISVTFSSSAKSFPTQMSQGRGVKLGGPTRICYACPVKNRTGNRVEPQVCFSGVDGLVLKVADVGHGGKI